MRNDQDAIKCTKEAEVALTAQLRLAAEKIEKFESKLAVLKGSDVFVSALISMQLETTYQEIAHLKAKLSVTHAMLEVAMKEVSRVALVVKDLERVNSELRSACFAK
ncbi:hypothetical protein EV2_003316 [Malus domestica]